MSPTVGQMRVDQADYARDAKKEGGMCARGLCQSNPQRPAPDGFRGRYGGTNVCQDCYEELVDYIALHGHLPNENECSDDVGRLV